MKLFCLQCAGGQLREIATGDAFRYDVCPDDKERNEERYQEIAKVVIYVCSVSILFHVQANFYLSRSSKCHSRRIV